MSIARALSATRFQAAGSGIGTAHVQRMSAYVQPAVGGSACFSSFASMVAPSGQEATGATAALMKAASTRITWENALGSLGGAAIIYIVCDNVKDLVDARLANESRIREEFQRGAIFAHQEHVRTTQDQHFALQAEFDNMRKEVLSLRKKQLERLKKSIELQNDLEKLQRRWFFTGFFR